MMNNQYVLLWLEGPLQSWGVDSKFGRRDSLNFPTKSGILGLICSALGASGEQRELLAEFSTLDMQIVSYRKPNVSKLPLLRDFHMVGSGYANSNNPWQELLIPRKSDGSKAVGGGAKLTYRYYLQDAVFAVLLQLPENLVECCVNALQYPHWDIFLGRKNCIPSEIIYRGVYTDSLKAKDAADNIATTKEYILDFSVFQGDVANADTKLTLNDVPIQFGISKLYRDRLVSIINNAEWHEK